MISENTQNALAMAVKHPNAGAVLVLGLGCEDNRIEEFKKVLGPYDSRRVRFLETQQVEDEISEGADLLEELYAAVRADQTDRGSAFYAAGRYGMRRLRRLFRPDG